jgi:hypothetical protein
VGPRGHKVDLLRVPACQEPRRPPRGGLRARERCQCEDAEARPFDDERAASRRCFDNPSVEPLHAPLADVRVDFEDILHHLEVVL